MGQFTARTVMLGVVVMVTHLVAACGGGVELKGGVFDVLGVNDIQGRTEPKMASRPGLVVPPSTASLPAPGAAPPTVIASNGEAFPVNPEVAKQQKNAEVLQRHNAFCVEARRRERIGISATLEDSPWGSCHQSVLRNLTGKDLSGKRAVGTQ